MPTAMVSSPDSSMPRLMSTGLPSALMAVQAIGMVRLQVTGSAPILSSSCPPAASPARLTRA